MTTPSKTAPTKAPTPFARAWRSLVRKGWPLFSIVVLLVVAVAAIAGPDLAPKDPNRQNII